MDQQLSRELLVEDAYQLRDMIEDAHPDPYLNGGGKIAFHRRFHEVLGRIPEQGMTAGEFLALLQPFVAAIGDSHTAVRAAAGETTPLSLPVGFRIVDEQLVVDRVATQQQAPLLGSRLLAMEGVPLAELVERQGGLRGVENHYGALAVMILRTLTTRQGLAQLIPEWQGAALSASSADGRGEVPRAHRAPAAGPPSHAGFHAVPRGLGRATARS
jgi:hypothetical protein